MSVTIKFTISDEHHADLCIRANAAQLSIQDYIRKELFGSEETLTPQAAIDKALEKYSTGDFFTVPQIFDGNFHLPNGIAGQFGKKFNALVEAKYSDKIRFTKTYDSKRHAIYEML